MYYFFLLVNTNNMKIRLGYACISNILNISSSKSMTLTNYKKLDKNISDKKLDELININLDNLLNIIKYNVSNNIHFFRMTTNLIPLMDITNIDLTKYEDKFNKIGKLINNSKMRVDCHISEYCVLNSIKESVINNSKVLLYNLKSVMDMFNIDYYIIMHIGSKNGGIKESINRFINSFNSLTKSLQNKIMLENDDKSFNAYNTLKLCEKLNIPMCLDIHHHNCNKCSRNIDYYIERIIKTSKTIPKMHFSSPKSKIKKEIRSHNDYIFINDFINFINMLKQCKVDVDIMLEAKQKDLALIKLVYELKYKEIYNFIDESSFNL